MRPHPPFLSAGNAGPFTLDGTRTYRVGRSSAVVLDPGPDVEDHVRALLVWLSDAADVRLVVTHGHRDHAGAAPRLAAALGVPVMGPAGAEGVEVPLADGAVLATDEGALTALETPGHAERHLSFHQEDRRAVFVGDLLLGKGDTTWVAGYPGCVADYLASLERVRALNAETLYPAHGDPITDPPEALDRYERHRRERIRQVRDALCAQPGASLDELLRVVYPAPMPSAVERAARMSLAALVEHVRNDVGA